MNMAWHLPPGLSGYRVHTLQIACLMHFVPATSGRGYRMSFLKYFFASLSWSKWFFAELLTHPFWRQKFDKAKFASRKAQFVSFNNLFCCRSGAKFDFEDIAQFSSCNAVLFDRCGSSANPVCFWRAWHSLACNGALTFEGPASPGLIPKAVLLSHSFKFKTSKFLSLLLLEQCQPSLILRT